MRILILNQYLPPDPAPTGVLLGELAECLRASGHEVQMVSASGNYRPGQAKGGRLKREVTALLRLLAGGVCASGVDLVISATSPPCLLLAATLVALRHRAKSIHWAMDLYPELAVALGEVPRGILSRALAGAMGWCYRQSDRVVALDQDMAEHLREAYGVPVEICRPWVFAPVLKTLGRVLAIQREVQRPWTWIYSGNLGRAHEWETLLLAQREVERKNGEIRLLFQGGGPSWPAAQRRARELGLQRCEWQPYVPEEELPSTLMKCGACVATQRPEATGLLWPSKLGLLLALPRALLWVGTPGSALTQVLGEQHQVGTFAPGEPARIAEWLLKQREQLVPREPAERPESLRKVALQWWEQLVARLES